MNMKRDAGRSRPRQAEAGHAPRTQFRWLIVVSLLLLAIGVAGIAAILRAEPAAEPVAWARLGTQDIHSLAFVDNDPSRLLFGHHGGVLSTTDGGRSWSSLPVRDDAMSTSPGADGSVVIAGHNVFAASRDRGSTWSPIVADLPSLDIHGFSRDPGDPARMWAYLATGGLWESRDFGLRWERVREDNVLFPLAVRGPSGTRLIGVDASGLVASDDGGRSWSSLTSPETFPMTALAATPDGQVLYAGSQTGLFRSRDGGLSWSATPYSGSTYAVATPDGQVVAVVSREAEFFRSADGGSSWPGP